MPSFFRQDPSKYLHECAGTGQIHVQVVRFLRRIGDVRSRSGKVSYIAYGYTLKC